MRTREEPPGRPSELLDLRLLGSALRRVLRGVQLARRTLVRQRVERVVRLLCVRARLLVPEDEVDPGVDRPADRLALERLAVLQDENPGAPVRPGREPDVAQLLPVHLARSQAQVSSVHQEVPRTAEKLGYELLDVRRRQQRAVEGLGEPVEQTVRRVERAALQTQVVLGVAPEQPVQHVPGGAVVRAVQEMTRGCVWRIGRCPWQHAGQRGLAHLRRALAERAEPPRLERAHRPAQVPEARDVVQVQPLRGVVPQDPGHHRPLRQVAVAPPGRHVQVYQVVERGKVTHAPQVRRGAERARLRLGQRRTDARRAFTKKLFCFFARLALRGSARRRRGERGGDARLTLRLRAQREQRARGSVRLLPGNGALARLGEEEKLNPERPRRVRPPGDGDDAARVAHFEAFSRFRVFAFGFRILHRRYLGERLEVHARVRDDQPARLAHQGGHPRGGRVERDAISLAQIRQRVYVESRAVLAAATHRRERRLRHRGRLPRHLQQSARGLEELRERFPGKLEPPRRERVRRRDARRGVGVAGAAHQSHLRAHQLERAPPHLVCGGARSFWLRLEPSSVRTGHLGGLVWGACIRYDGGDRFSATHRLHESTDPFDASHFWLLGRAPLVR